MKRRVPAKDSGGLTSRSAVIGSLRVALVYFLACGTARAEQPVYTITDLLARHQETVEKITSFEYEVERYRASLSDSAPIGPKFVGKVVSAGSRYLAEARFAGQVNGGTAQPIAQISLINAPLYMHLTRFNPDEPPRAARISAVDASMLPEEERESPKFIVNMGIPYPEMFAFTGTPASPEGPRPPLSEFLPEHLTCRDGDIRFPIDGLGAWSVSHEERTGHFVATVSFNDQRHQEYAFDPAAGFLLARRTIYMLGEEEPSFNFTVDFELIDGLPFPKLIVNDRYLEGDEDRMIYRVSNIQLNKAYPAELFTADEIVRRAPEIPQLVYRNETTGEERLYSFGKPASQREAQQALFEAQPEEVRLRAQAPEPVAVSLAQAQAPTRYSGWLIYGGAAFLLIAGTTFLIFRRNAG